MRLTEAAAASVAISVERGWWLGWGTEEDGWPSEGGRAMVPEGHC